jgi:hypothetical protein
MSVLGFDLRHYLEARAGATLEALFLLPPFAASRNR